MGHEPQKALPAIIVPECARVGVDHRAVVVLGTPAKAISAVQNEQVIIRRQATIGVSKHLGCGCYERTHILDEPLFIAIPDTINQKIDVHARCFK